MSDAAVADQVLAFVAEVSGWSAESLRPDVRLVDDLAFDSIELLELDVVLEEAGVGRLPVQLDPRDLTVGDLLNACEQWRSHGRTR